MGEPAVKNERYTYFDYQQWTDDERWELIKGRAYNMSPAPNTRHQTIQLEFARQFSNYLKGKKCKVFIPPFDVVFAEKKEDAEFAENVVQPDISVFCDINKLTLKGAVGAPDLVIEILSPSTAKKDLSEKLLLYQKFEVKEYWIVDPDLNTLDVFLLSDNKMYDAAKKYAREDKVAPSIFSDLPIDLSDVFAQD